MDIQTFVVTLAFVALTLTQNAVQDRLPGPEVSTSLGRIKGSYMKTRLNKTICAFRGIRYAEPPTGELRFKIAVPVKAWNDVFDASDEGPSCPRPSGKLANEDCLRVNVYTTKIPTNSSNANVAEGTKKPVMVFFHPGGFHGFSGQSYLFGPQYILDQDIVLVTVNFRLGALGFLATGDSVAPGNLGLKDQVAALRWIRDNIASFGGDPDCVTISGYSSGSRSVALHLVSPMSKGLFHRAIAMSGSPTKGEALPRHQIEYAKKQARIFSCPDDTSDKIVECLKTKSADEIAKTFPQFAEWHFDPITIWSPVVEPDIPGLERFLTDEPVNLIREGKIHQVPFMTGVTRDEFGYLTMPEVNEARKGNDSTFRDLDQNWEEIAPISFLYERNTPRSKRISQRLRDYYFKGQPISLETVKGHARCYADSIVGFPIHRLVHLVAAVSKKPVYYYRFVYEGRYSFAKWSDTQKPYGVGHHDDLQYLFYMSQLHYFELEAPETPMVDRMTAMWANFVKTGEPIPKNNKAFEGVTWEQFTPENNRYMEINRTLTMKAGLNLEAIQLFETLFPLDPLPGKYFWPWQTLFCSNIINTHRYRMILPFFLVTFVLVTLTLPQDAAGNNIPVNPEVSTPLGRIKGSLMTSRLNQEIYAFRGIRYGEPPTGDLRFEVAVPAEPWDDVFDASEEGPSCPSISGKLMNEDCLRLNVYTTEIPTNASSATDNEAPKKSVMVFIHPGGFCTLSGQSYLFGPQYLLDYDIVLVTINYRLGSLGFLATGDAVAPGNIGLKDQVVALQWVRDNIASFGGDPNSVTITGSSAGSRSVPLHMISPMSKGLFHRAISMSGSPIRAEPMGHDQIEYAKKQARLLDCPDDTSEKIVECLRTKSAEEIGKSFSKFTEWHYDPKTTWFPVVEPDIPGRERFLTDQPVNLIREGKIHQVPYMVGLTRDEFGYVTMLEVEQANKGNDSMFRDLNENWDDIAPISFQYERNTPRSKMISQRLRDFYFEGQPVSLETVKSHAHCYADSIVGFPTHRLVHLVAGASKQPIYYYRFVHEGKYSLFEWPNTGKPYGVAHLDDLQYLFYMSQLHYFEPGVPETPLVEMMTAMWANFVKTGEPIPKSNRAFEGVTWEQFTPENNRYMEINRTLTMKTGINLERMQVFETLFPLYPLPRSITSSPDD
ncbi:uncharacterized protein [Venturia canescens]|uniref:uncharacterized protein n=1 Tax=Venturia canescens TaxID=32260 RepID=UPI001C9D230E|nr:uncharacterized protein LOC122407263 [Venturia canescens]